MIFLAMQEFEGNLQADFAVGTVRITIPHLPVCGVVIDHGVHIPGGDAERQFGLSEGHPRFGGVPIGLGENGNAKSIGFENAGKQSGGETRMIDVCVSPQKGNTAEDDIDGIPAAGKHFRASEWERLHNM